MNVKYFLFLPTVFLMAEACSEVTLQKDLLKYYNKFTRPVRNKNTSVFVDVIASLNTLYDFNVFQGIIVGEVYISLLWKDEYLAWNKTEYGNADSTILPKTKIWTPNVYICNAIKVIGNRRYERQVTVKQNGVVTEESFYTYQLFCGVDNSMYPFDAQTCHTYICLPYQIDNSTVLKSLGTYKVDDMEGWHIHISTEQPKSYRGQQFGTLLIRLTRTATFSRLIIILPPIMLTILITCACFLPPSSGERVTFSTTVFLSNMVYLIDNTSLLSAKEEKICVFLLYLMGLTIMGGFSCISSILLSRTYIYQKPPTTNSKISPTLPATRETESKIISTDAIYSLQRISAINEKKTSMNGMTKWEKLDRIFFFLSTTIFMSLTVIFAILYTQ